MELKRLIGMFKEYILSIALVSFIFGFAGIVLFYVLPPCYKAAGSLYVTREIEDTTLNYFTYEGYYAQQTAKSHTETVMGMLESIDMRKRALEKQQILVTEETLREASRNIQVKTPAPQMVVLEVGGKNPVEARTFWMALASETISAAKKLNESGDPNLEIIALDNFPVVYKTFRSVYVNLGVGLLFGIFVSLAVVSFKEYFS